MNFGKIFKSFIFFGSVIYTVISTIMIIIATATTDGQYAMMLDAERFLCILLFSFTLSVGSTVWRIDEISRVAATCIHAACYVLGFLIFVILCGVEFTPAVVSTVIFAVIYTVCTVIARLIAKSHKKAPASKKAVSKQAKETKNTEYKNLFTK